MFINKFYLAVCSRHVLLNICSYLYCESTTRFICTRCWLWIFCKLCLSEELNNLININRVVTALFTCIANTYIVKTRHSLCSYTQNNSNVFAHMLQLIYITHIYTAKARLSFCAYTHQCNIVNWSIYWFSDWLTCVTNIYTAKVQHSLCSYTQKDSNVFAYMLQLIYITYIYIAKTWFNLCIYTH